MARGEAEERVGSTTRDPDDRRSAEEVQKIQVHRYEADVLSTSGVFKHGCW